MGVVLLYFPVGDTSYQSWDKAKISRPTYMKPTPHQIPNFHDYHQPQNDAKFILKCILGIVLIISGLFSIAFFNSIPSGVLRIIAGLLLFPPTLNFVERQLKITLPRVVRYIVIIIIFQVSVVISYFQIIDHSNEKHTQVDSGNINNVKSINKNSLTKDSAAKVQKDKSLTSADDDSISVDSLNKLAQEEKPLIEAQKERERKLNYFQEKYISGWDGSFRPLVKYVKDRMNDPDSFEHVSTNFWSQGDHVVVAMQFRGTNKFGAKVLNSIKAEVNWNGKVINFINE